MSVALLAALLAGMLLINVAVAWTLARRDRGPGDAPDAEGRPPDDDPTGFDAVLARRGARERSADGDDDALSPSADPSADEPPPLEADGETVVCGNCGARNRSGYRYCRWCVRSALVDDGRGRGDAAGAARRPL
ncbi:DUF7577 domain-containing protein [Halorubrum aethiopicum]|uniref:DUF7577 domain-containing protein n=1 Tax=Halorubrum aethiopicum TaxID=1758255 RepID=UPI00082D85DA|nr:hypothetical protein [Halorubrum aethiopicum]